MDPATRWSATLHLDWGPVLTFERRRLEYLDWLEEEVGPPGFLDEDQVVGVAVSRHGERVVVTRNGVFLELRTPKATPDSLEQVLAGAKAVFGVSHFHDNGYRGAWSYALDGEYAELAATLASRTIPSGLAASGATATDGAYLMDLTSPWGNLLIEFGIVTRDELEERITDPEMGRIGSNGLVSSLVDSSDELPEVSLFVDVLVRATEEPLADVEAVLDRYRTIESKVTELVSDLVTTVR